MSGPARVASLAVVADFKAALQTFRDDVQDAITSVNVVNQQILDWIEHDQLKHWQAQIRKAEEALNEAKGDLHRKKITSMNEFSSHVEERKAVQKAQARVEHAEDKVKACRAWSVRARQEIEEFHSQGQFLSNVVDQDLPKALAFLENALRTLEEYVALQSPGAGEYLAATSSAAAVEIPTAAASPPASDKPAAPEAKPGDVASDDDLPSAPPAAPPS